MIVVDEEIVFTQKFQLVDRVKIESSDFGSGSAVKFVINDVLWFEVVEQIFPERCELVFIISLLVGV